MKIIHPSAELFLQSSGTEGIYSHIERIGRICYKSEDRITPGSAKPFVDRMIKSRHYAMLEHGTVYLSFPAWICVWGKYLKNLYSRVQTCVIHNEQRVAVTTNFRILVENSWLDDLQYVCDPTEFHFPRITVHFICDRGVSHEFVRHRSFSFAQESTRYCRYSKDKFNKEITFIAPYWFDKKKENCDSLHDVRRDIFIYNCINAEDAYFDMLDTKASPQEARAVLTNSLKTELVMTGFEADWSHFFDLRYRGTTGAPHPDAKLIATKAHDAILHQLGKDL